MSLFSARRGRSALDRERELARRLEEHVHFTLLEARAYVDHRLAAIEHRSAVSREELERSSLLTVQEAKAYADEAATSLARSLRGVAGAVLRASRDAARVSSQVDPADFKGTLPQRLALFSGAVSEAASEGVVQADVRGSIEQLNCAVGRLATSLESVAATTENIERILANLTENLADREDAPSDCKL